MNLVEAGYAAGWKLVRLLPERAARAAFTAGADLTTRRGGRGPWQLSRNLRRVIGDEPSEDELADLVRAGMRSYARYWVEAFRLPDMPHEAIRDTFHMETPELFQHQVLGGSVLALSHSANWEHAGVWVTSQGQPLISVAERLKPEGLYQRFVAYRTKLGIEVLPNRGGDRPVIEVLAERLAAGHVVALLADRDLSVRGIPVTFFGHPTRMPAGPALLALQNNKPLFGANLWYEADGTHARLTGPLTPRVDGSLSERVADLTQQVADVFAAGIAAHPEDWHMLSRLWLDDKPAQPSTPAAPQPAQAG